MRYEAILAAAFVAGLCGAMSQQTVKSPVNHLEMAAFEQSVAIPIAPAPTPARQLAPAEPQVSEAAPAPAPVAAPAAAPAPIAAPAEPVKHAHAKHKKLAARAPPKPAVAQAEEHHSFWYRLFHKNGDDQVATATH